MIHPHSGSRPGPGLFCISGPDPCILLACLAFIWLLLPSAALMAAPTEAMLMPAPASPQKTTVPPVLLTPSAPLLPQLQYFIDHTGTMDVEEVAAPANVSAFQPLQMKTLPRSAGVMWLRFTLAPLPQGVKPGAMLLDMGASVPDGPVLYEPRTNLLTDAVEWREITPSQRDVLLLPEAGNEPITCYIRLDGLPGLWFEPMLRTPQDAANNWGSLAGTAAVLALAVVMLLCLLRGLSERGQWRIWTALYVGAALAQAVMGMPAYGAGRITVMEAAAVLSPGVALMLLPHVGRHLLRTKGRSRLLDAQFVLLSLPGAVLALLPLLPGFGWLIRYLALWPLCTLIFVPSAVGGAVMGLGGARRFLLGCLLPPAFTAAGILGLDSGYAANLMASAPLWGTALSALIIAGTGAPRDSADDAARGGRKKNVSTPGPAGSPGSPGLDGLGLLPSAGDAGGSGNAPARTGADAGLSLDGVINLDQPLDDPNLRLLPPVSAADNSGQGRWNRPEGSASADAGLSLTEDAVWSSCSAPASHAAGAAQKARSGADACLWENTLRPPLERLLREGAALGNCALPPAVRQYAENMLEAAADMAHALDNPGKGLEQSRIGETRSAFNLQHMVREAHDAVSAAAENAGIGLAWYMPPLLGHTYEGQAQTLRETLCLLLESAVRATSRGAVHLSVRRVPESPDPGHLLFTVSDTGAGIPPRNRSTLALARAWELAGTNNCYLNVECTPQGTSISFTLRLKPLEHEASAPEELRLHVAVVADGAVERQSFAHMVAGMGLSSTEARTVREALELNRENPALLLVAHEPVDGSAACDVLDRFKKQAMEAGLPFCKALAVTADDSRWDALADTGYTHALLEPVDKTVFAATVQEILEEAGISLPGAGEEDVEGRNAEAHGGPEHESHDGRPHENYATGERPANVADPLEGMLSAAKGADAPASPLPDLFGSEQSWAAPGGASSRLPDLTALPQILGLADQMGGGLPPVHDGSAAPAAAAASGAPDVADVADAPGVAGAPGMADAVARPGTAEDDPAASAADTEMLQAHASLAPDHADHAGHTEHAGHAEQPEPPVEREVPDLFGVEEGQESAWESALEHVPGYGQDDASGVSAQAYMPAEEYDAGDIAPTDAAPAAASAAEKTADASGHAIGHAADHIATGHAADFIASAGLEGPTWGGEAPSGSDGAVAEETTSSVHEAHQEAEHASAVPGEGGRAPVETAPDMARDVPVAPHAALVTEPEADTPSDLLPEQSTVSPERPVEQPAEALPGAPIVAETEPPEPQDSAADAVRPASGEASAIAGQPSLTDTPADVDADAPRSAEDSAPVQADHASPLGTDSVQHESSVQIAAAAEPVQADTVVSGTRDPAENAGAEAPAAGTLAAAVSGSGGQPGQPVISVRGRIGEAVLRPVNAPLPEAAEGGSLSGLSGQSGQSGQSGLSGLSGLSATPEAKPSHQEQTPPVAGMPSDTVPASGPSTEEDARPEAYLDATYPGPLDAVPHEKLDWGGEWVGDPVPVGAPTSSGRPAPASPASAPDAPLPAGGIGDYVSPSLARPGEWVGEPMPLDRSAIKETRPEPPAPERRPIPWPGDTPAGQSAVAAGRSDKTPSSQREMPRTATGRLILKLLGSTADTAPVTENAQESSRRGGEASRPLGGDAGQRPVSAGRSVSDDASIVDFIAGATPPAGSSAPVSGANAPAATVQAVSTSAAMQAAPAQPQPQPRQQDAALLRLVERLDAAMEDAQRAYKGHNCLAVAEASGRIANESDGFGFRVLARMARCVERAARANDMSALRDLLPELAVAVERNRIALNPHPQGR